MPLLSGQIRVAAQVVLPLFKGAVDSVALWNLNCAT